MHIGVLTTSFPRFAGDPAGNFVLESAQALAARGHFVEVLAPEPSHGQRPTFDGIDLHWLRYARPRSLQRTFYGAGVPDNLSAAPWLAYGVASYGMSLRAAVTKRSRRWDALVSHWALPCGVAGALGAKPNRPHLAFCHSADVFALTHNPIGRPVRRWLVDRRCRFWFVSEHHARTFLGDLSLDKRQDIRQHISPMGVATHGAVCDRATCRARWNMTGFNVLAMGRLIPIKGLQDAIVALSGWPESHLWLAGEGPERQRLQQLAKLHRVSLRVVGPVSGEDKHTLLAAADALVVPSRVTRAGRSEGFPTVISEAHAAGLPVVATDVGGIPDGLRDGVDALVVPSRSPTSLATGLRKLAVAPELRQALIAAGKQRAKSLHWPVLAAQMETMLS